MFKFCLIFTLFIIKNIVCFSEMCKHLQVSTNITETKTDVIKNGIVHNEWKQNAGNPMFTQTTLEIDYFYLTITNTQQPLKDKDLKLTMDKYDQADSRAEIIYSRNLGKGIYQYTVGVHYRCQNFAGQLLTYKLEMMVPNCGSNSVYWKKICGSSSSPRTGLSMDMQVSHKLSQPIVKNGQLTKAQYFDEDIDNYVFKVPKHQQETNFVIYMEVDEDKTQKNFKQSDNAFEVLQDAMMLVPEERLEPFFIDGNEEIINPVVEGKIVNGGTLTKQKQRFTVKYHCKRYGESTVQLQIPMQYFKDINIFFVKQCGHMLGTEFVDFEQRVGLFSLIVLILFFTLIGSTLYNVIYNQKEGIEAIPYLKEFIDFMMDFTVVQNATEIISSKINDSISKLRQFHGNSQNIEYQQVNDAENQQSQSSQSQQQQQEEQLEDMSNKKDGQYGGL